MQQSVKPLAQRYGRPPDRRPLAVLAVTVLALAFLSWVVWAALAASGRPQAEVTGFRVTSADRVQVTVRPLSDHAAMTCELRAMDRTGDVVGIGQVELRRADSDGGSASVVLRTRARAVTATVHSCRSR